MQTGTDGCKWVCMGVLGCKDTNAHKNKTKQDKNECAGYAFDGCMAGKFPGKYDIQTCRHKGVRRDSGGWGWVRMGAGGCIST